MAPDIMAPPTISHVGGVGCEVWLEIQRLPSDNGISREAHRITMAAKTCITGKSNLPVASPAAIQIVIMVQHPKRI
ncbi:hypothetical protein D3C76_1615470 [compost metagenome]